MQIWKVSLQQHIQTLTLCCHRTNKSLSINFSLQINPNCYFHISVALSCGAALTWLKAVLSAQLGLSLNLLTLHAADWACYWDNNSLKGCWMLDKISEPFVSLHIIWLLLSSLLKKVTKGHGEWKIWLKKNNIFSGIDGNQTLNLTM